jgi:hypothetical protein
MKVCNDYNDTTQHYIISECGSSKSMTCKMLITDMYFTSNLTKQVLSKNRSYNDLICKSTNVVYDLECNVCGLVYVGK